MPSVFHAVPHPMTGSVLYPLNELKERDPEVSPREVAKYEGREAVRELHVPILDCLWNDVLHFSTVDPRDVAAALEAVGLEPLRRRFFEIDARELDPGHAVLFLNRRSDFTAESEWRRFDPRDVARLSRLRVRACRYYAGCAAADKRPRLYAYLPHVLFRGSLETRDLRVLDV